MPENRVDGRLEEMVRNAVAQALERQLSSLRESVVQEVLSEIAPALAGQNKGKGTSAEPALSGNAILQRAVSAIQAGANQKEILRALLDNSSLYSGRAALFIIKGGTASGWQGTGFSGSQSVKDFVPDITTGIAARVMQLRSAEAGRISEFDHQFAAKFGTPSDAQMVLLPLLLKDKISALVYADGGTDGETSATLDVAALDVLVRATSAWLEVISQRKHAQKDGAAEPETNSANAVNDPFAAHSPVHGKTETAAQAAPVVAMSAAAAAWGGPSSSPSPGRAVPPAVAPAETEADTEIHRKAQRFARLLIDEIKLYNQSKVTEGRKHKDLYDRLKEDIDKSRTTYQKRYGTLAASGADYFTQELIRNIAQDDVSLLGPNFRR